MATIQHGPEELELHQPQDPEEQPKADALASAAWEKLEANVHDAVDKGLPLSEIEEIHGPFAVDLAHVIREQRWQQQLEQ